MKKNSFESYSKQFIIPHVLTYLSLLFSSLLMVSDNLTEVPIKNSSKKAGNIVAE